MAQERPILHGRVVDSSGRAVSAAVTAYQNGVRDSVLGRGTTSADGSFHFALAHLPATLLVEATTEEQLPARLVLDSAAVRASAQRPVMLRLGRPQEIAQVEVRAKYQRRPSVNNYFVTEPATRSEMLGPTSATYDPLSPGGLDLMLASSPELLIGGDLSPSALGAPATENQLQIDGIQVPGVLGTGLLNGNLLVSPWDASVGGTAGATLNLMIRRAGRYRSSYTIARGGASGVPQWLTPPGVSAGLSAPVQVGLGTTGPLGRYAYRLYGFVGRERSPGHGLEAAVSSDTRSVLDSLANVLAVRTDADGDRRSETGFIGRLELRPADPTSVLAISGGVTRSISSKQLFGGYATASAGTEQTDDAGFVRLESSRVIAERVLWTTIVSTSAAARRGDAFVAAPLLLVTDQSLGRLILTGGAGPQADSRSITAEARSTWTWYSVSNRVRYLAQLQGRFDHEWIGAHSPHSTFTVGSIDALRGGSALSLLRASGGSEATARSLVAAPSITTQIEIGKRGTLLVGARGDAWRVNGIDRGHVLASIDLSPRLAIEHQLGTRKRGGAVATLRAGAGLFTGWPRLLQWSDAWQSSVGPRELCAGAGVPSIDLTIPAAACEGGASVQTIAGVVASGSLRPPAASRGDVSLSFSEVLPGVRAEVGASVARNTRILARRSPFAELPVASTLAGEGGRALLVPVGDIGADGVVPVADIPDGVDDSETLLSLGASRATQWRVRAGTRDPFARFKVDVTYVFTTGRERTLLVADPGGAPDLLSMPLSASGRHTVALSLGSWLGPADIRLSGMVRSGARFTPLADRDLNGDGRHNDAAFVPAGAAASWAAQVDPALRDCVMRSAGRIAGINSCTGPWSVWSLLQASLPGNSIRLPRGSVIDLQLSNPLGLFAKIGNRSAVTYGPPAVVDPTLVRITGFDQSLQRFAGAPLSRFGQASTVSPRLSAPIRIALSVRLPLGPSVTGQRADAAIAALAADTSARGQQRAVMGFLADLPPLPIMVLQSAAPAGITGEQREQLQGLAARWQRSTSTLVLGAYHNPSGERVGLVDRRDRLVRARQSAVGELQAIAAEIRAILTPDQLERLPEGIQRVLNPRLLRYLAAMDSGEF